MKKIQFIILFVFICAGVKAQINYQNLYGNWIKVKVTYNNDKPLVYGNTFKYSYCKYTFTSDGKLGFNAIYFTSNLDKRYLKSDSILTITNSTGVKINEYLIAKLTADQLVLIQDAGSGYDKPDAMKLYFISEAAFQKAHKVERPDISIMANGDTLYNESPFIYPTFNANGQDIQTYLQEQIRKSVSMDNREGHFRATFIVSKTGSIDSLKIISGIAPDYDKAFMKCFAKCPANWQPATLQGKPVNVKVTLKFNYFTSDKMMPFMRLTDEANKALNNGDYTIAIHYFDQASEYVPDDITNLYKATLCKLVSGKSDGVCDALQKINSSGLMIVDELINIVCKPKTD
jgi:hypothetical protein